MFIIFFAHKRVGVVYFPRTMVGEINSADSSSFFDPQRKKKRLFEKRKVASHVTLQFQSIFHAQTSPALFQPFAIFECQFFRSSVLFLSFHVYRSVAFPSGRVAKNTVIIETRIRTSLRINRGNYAELKELFQYLPSQL